MPRNVPIGSRVRVRGFTFTELILVIMILGVLAVVALPRFASRDDFTLQGTYDRAFAVVRYAQKAAIAARVPVLVTVAGNGLGACFAPSGSCASDVTDPTTGSAMQVNGTSGVAIEGTSVTFDALGRPSVGPVSITVSAGSAMKTFVIEAETGYAHAQ